MWSNVAAIEVSVGLHFSLREIPLPRVATLPAEVIHSRVQDGGSWLPAGC